MKTLIWQQTHIRNPAQGKLWAVNQKLIRRLNPDVDLLVIDNASPLDPLQFMPGTRWAQCKLGPMSEVVPQLEPGRHVGDGTPALVRFHESLGHFFHGHTHGRPVKDGPGRAHTRALQIAIASGYDRAVYLEADALFAKPVSWGFEQLTKPIGAQPAGKYYTTDWHAWFIKDLLWLLDFDFIGKYDWQRRVGEPGGEPAGEDVYIRIFGDHIQHLPIRGDRGDATGLTAQNMRQQYPDGLDLVTHVDLPAFAEWLRWQGHDDLAADL